MIVVEDDATGTDAAGQAGGADPQHDQPQHEQRHHRTRRAPTRPAGHGGPDERDGRHAHRATRRAPAAPPPPGGHQQRDDQQRAQRPRPGKRHQITRPEPHDRSGRAPVGHGKAMAAAMSASGQRQPLVRDGQPQVDRRGDAVKLADGGGGMVRAAGGLQRSCLRASLIERGEQVIAVNIDGRPGGGADADGIARGCRPSRPPRGGQAGTLTPCPWSCPSENITIVADGQYPMSGNGTRPGSWGIDW